jgi:hypothetical protein
MSLEQQSKIRDILEANKINYKLEMSCPSSYSGKRGYVCESYIYVNRKDYEKAIDLISYVK